MHTPHRIRSTTSLNRLWDFVFLGPIDLDSFSLDSVELFDRMPVPSAFDALPALAGKRGAALYKTQLSIEPGHPARLEFSAVSLWARIYIDRVPVKEHACGYAPFTVDVPPSSLVDRELVVLIDNRFDFARSHA